MVDLQLRGTALGFLEDDSSLYGMTELFPPGTSLGEISDHQESDVSFKLHRHGWYEIYDATGEKFYGVFIPRSMEPPMDLIYKAYGYT